MSLSELQQLFAATTIALYQRILAEGYKFTYGETWRDPRIAALNAKAGTGIAHSLHTDRLAVDINLFKNGIYLPNTSDHALFGAYWKTLHPLARWGGDFKDGNHYSFTWEGRQ